ncbi:MAG: S8 family serine peptidase [Nitrosopumilus sp.]|nr:S8 family serine peptidase [Nitrosopumilus sp.]
MSRKDSSNNDEELDDISIYETPELQYEVQLKFKSEIGARLDEAHRLESTTKTDLSSVEQICKKHQVKMERAFDQTEDELEAQFADAKASGIELPQLSRSYTIKVKDKKSADLIAKDLEKEDSIESIEVVPPAYPASLEPPTIDFSGSQGYLEPAPGGIDAKFAWTIPGGKGATIKMIDIEGAWNFNHEDMVQNQGGLAGGTMNSSLGWRNHGTAVLGEIGGDDNNFGVTGIAPLCNQRGYSIFGSGNGSAKAIVNAANQLLAGDIILIELHRPGPDANGRGQDGFIALEYWQQDFDAIKYATSKGVIVVEAAGNGSRNLDDTVFQNRFSRSIRGDCGAILVGAGAPPSGNHGPDRSRLGFSNYGKSVDCQGWGRDVVTTGYGDLQRGNENQWYTRVFSGTSSASPIIVGAVACLQGIREAKGDSLLTYSQLRNLFATTGSPQQDAPGRPVSQNIGKRPNLREAYYRLYPKHTCSQYLDKARHYYKAYRSSRDRRYLCRYYYYLAIYNRCLYQEKKIKRYLCLYYYYKALFYLCQYRLTRNTRYLSNYRKFITIYRKCR